MIRKPQFLVLGKKSWDDFLRTSCQKPPIVLFVVTAAGLGLEPRLLVPETSVLPLDDPAALPTNYRQFSRFARNRIKQKAVSVLFPPPRRSGN